MKNRINTANLWKVMILFLALAGCKQNTQDIVPFEDMLRTVNDALNAVIIEDGFPPPVASRIYAHSYLAGYQCVSVVDERYPDLSHVLNDYEHNFEATDLDMDLYIPEIAAMTATLITAKALTYRKFIIEEYETKLAEQLTKLIDKERLEYSLDKGAYFAEIMIEHSGTDNYKETRNMPFHNSTGEWGTWEPTPPMYGTAIEPHWEKIRPFVIDSIDAFLTNYPLNYDTARGSEFYEEAMIVYDAVMNLDEDKFAQASHWDCNPRESLTSGHMVAQIKQMNPGGHWLGIGHTVMKQEGTPFRDMLYVSAYTALSISDGFIVCWKEKYSTNLIRPETYINRYIDPEWQPILETPLFPEYSSGHSVISGIASTVLTELVGDEIAYVDSVNYMFDLPPRSFESFHHAAEEAAMSRLYGGIHYLPAVKNGLVQGRSVAQHILNELPLKD